MTRPIRMQAYRNATVAARQKVIRSPVTSITVRVRNTTGRSTTPTANCVSSAPHPEAQALRREAQQHEPESGHERGDEDDPQTQEYAGLGDRVRPPRRHRRRTAVLELVVPVVPVPLGDAPAFRRPSSSPSSLLGRPAGLVRQRNGQPEQKQERTRADRSEAAAPRIGRGPIANPTSGAESTDPGTS